MLKRLRLGSCLNMRDIGGYETNSGAVTKYKRFLRSDDIARCTENEIQQIKDFGINTVIDLRSSYEVERIPNVFSTIEGVAYHHISIMEGIIKIDDITKPNAQAMNKFGLKKLYKGLLENVEIMKQLFMVIAQNTDGTILFHCTAGKDRTGITAAILLMLVGVDKHDIMADYQVSYTYLLPRLEYLQKTHPELPQHLLESQPETIGGFYDYLTENYGSAYEYLLKTGMNAEEIESIKGGFLCTN